MDFIAHLVQRPHERVNHALLITSEAKGIGKSTLGTVIRKLVGERNAHAVQSKDLKSRFDDWLMGKLVVQVDEIYEHGNWDLANKLKPLITEPSVSVNVKCSPQISVHNFARFIIFSNHSAPIDIEEGDRRYFVFESHAQPRYTDYYDDLNAFIDSTEGLASIYSWLKQRDISAFRPYAAPPVTMACACSSEKPSMFCPGFFFLRTLTPCATLTSSRPLATPQLRIAFSAASLLSLMVFTASPLSSSASFHLTT